MTLSRVIALTIASSFAMSSLWSEQTPPATPAANPLAGTWRLVSIETVRPNGEALTRWMGKRPTGTILYLPSGIVSVQVMRDPRPEPNKLGFAGATIAEKAAAMDGYYAYFGSYVVDTQTHTVTHRIETSLRPEEVGTEYRRNYTIDGDVVTLSTPPFQEEGEQRFNRLRWKRTK